jgi:hypothetical protein
MPFTFTDSSYTRLRGTDVTLRFRHWYNVEEEAAGSSHVRFRVRTAGYQYGLHDAAGRELLSFHWHPHGSSLETAPHIHLRQHTTPFDLSDMHLPSRRISFEYVVRLAVEKFGARPRTPDWRAVLDRTEREFEQRRSWG